MPARGLEPVQSQRLDLVVGLRECEVTVQRVDVAVRPDSPVQPRLRVAHGDPGSAVRDRPAQAREQRGRPLLDASRGRRYLRHLGPEGHP